LIKWVLPSVTAKSVTFGKYSQFIGWSKADAMPIRGRARSILGLTMVEILLAILLTAVVLIAVMVVLTQLMASAQKSNDLAGGAVVAERLLNEIVNQSGSTPPPLVQGVLVTGESGDRVTEYHYSTDTRVVDDSNPTGNSYLVTVDVWWEVPNKDASRANVGKLSTRLSRVIYRSLATPQP